MSSASSSTLTPALMRRTLAWLSTSLFRGMSRDALNTIWVMRFSATGGQRASLLPFSPSAEVSRFLFLSIRAQADAEQALRPLPCSCWSMHHRNSGWVGPAARDQPQPLRPEISWQVRRLGRGQVRIVSLASTSGVASPLPRAARRNRLQHGRQIRVRAKALGENGEAVAAQAGAVAAGKAHYHERIVSQAPVRAHANITRTREGGFRRSECRRVGLDAGRGSGVG